MKKLSILTKLAAATVLSTLLSSTAFAESIADIDVDFLNGNAHAPVLDSKFSPTAELFLQHDFTNSVSGRFGLKVENPDGTLSDSKVRLDQLVLSYDVNNVMYEVGKFGFLGSNFLQDFSSQWHTPIHVEKYGVENQIQADQFGVKVSKTTPLDKDIKLDTSLSFSRLIPELNDTLFGNNDAPRDGLTTKGFSPIVNMSLVESFKGGSWKLGTEFGSYTKGESTETAQKHVSVFGQFERTWGDNSESEGGFKTDFVQETTFIKDSHGVKGHDGVLSLSYAELSKKELFVKGLSVQVAAYYIHRPADLSDDDKAKIAGIEMGISYKFTKSCNGFVSVDREQHFTGPDRGIHIISGQAGLNCSFGW